MSAPSFDPEKLYEAVDRRRHQFAPVLSLRSIGRELRLSQSTFTRLQHGCSVDAHTLVKLMNWLGISYIHAFTTDAEEAHPDDR